MRGRCVQKGGDAMKRPHMPAVMQDTRLRSVILLAAIAGIAFGLTIPFLTLTARERGMSLRDIGIMASSYLIVQMCLQLPFGALSDRIGRRIPIAVGFALEGIATAGFTLADSPEAFIGLRVLQGISLALIMPALRALIADLTPIEQRGQAFAWLFAGFSGGILLGPPIGGLLAAPLGRNPVFLMSAVVNVIMVLFVILVVRAPARVESTGPSEKIPMRALFTPGLIGAFMVGFGARVPEGIFAGLWSIYLEDLGASDTVIGLSYSTFAVSSLLMTPYGGRLADRGMRWRIILIANMAMGALTIGYGVLPFIVAILMLGFMEGAVLSVATPALDAYLASTADPRIQGRVQGAFATISTSGAAVAALFGTVLYDLGHWVPFAIAGSALILVNLLAFRLIRTSEYAARARRMADIQVAIQADRDASTSSGAAAIA